MNRLSLSPSSSQGEIGTTSLGASEARPSSAAGEDPSPPPFITPDGGTGAIPKSTRMAPRPGSLVGPQLSATPPPLHGNKKFSVPRQRASSTSTSQAFCCEHCGASYAAKANLARHAKDCGARDRTKCLYCPLTFASFAATRLHERRAHHEQYRNALESKLGGPESAIFMKLATREARFLKGQVSIKELQRATGLTEHQVRQRREKPEYQKYLERAKREQRSSGIRSFTTVAAPATAVTAATPPEALVTEPVISGPTPARRPSISPTPALQLPTARRPPPQTSPSDLATGTTHGQPAPIARSQEAQIPSLGSSSRSRSPDVAKKRRRLSSPMQQPTPKRRVDCSVAEPSGGPTTADSTKRKRPLSAALSSPQDAPPSLRPRLTVHISPISFDEIDGPPSPPPEVPSRLSLTPSDLRSVGLPPSPVLPEEVLDEAFLKHLIGLRPTADESTCAFIGVGLSGTQADLNTAVQKWLERVFPRRNRRYPRRPHNVAPRPSQPPANSTQRRAANFKKAQDLFQKDPSSLAEKILKGSPLMQEDTYPTVNGVEELYSGLFESLTIRDAESIDDQRESENIYTPISSGEILAATKAWSNSAPGLDGITVAQVKRCTPRLLEVLFNILLYRKVTPTSWKASRTVLIPKDGDRSDPSNWRPITIGSAVQRLLHRILAKRLAAALPLHPAQRGFRSYDGTLSNIVMLDHYIKCRRQQGKTFNLVSLDVRKAFDTVSHSSIFRALNRLGVSPGLQDYISSTLTGAHTIISVGRACTRKIKFVRGVKQGDPLSPLLFNAVLDELVSRLNETQPGGTLTPGCKISALAFADDLVLLEDRELDMPIALGTTADFFTARGMTLNPRKCVAISAATIEGKSVPRSKPSFKIQGHAVQTVGSLATFRYLGLQFGSTGAAKPTVFNLVSWLNNLERAPLKPHQKFHVLKTYLVPRLLYGLQTPAITGEILSECDRLLRKTARRILHLNVHTGSQFLHATIRDGGLGLIQLRHKIPFILLRRLENIRSDDDDNHWSSIYNTEGPAMKFFDRVRVLARKGNPDPFWREEISTRPFSAGLQSTMDDASSRSWLRDVPRGWTGRDYVRAVQLRTGNLPTCGLPSNAPDQRRCRNGCPRIESLSHVLQGCPATHYERISRHNEIVAKMAKHTRSKGWTTEVEPHVRHADGQLYKPDLAIHLPDDRLLITDVQVCWEGPRTLAQSWENKRLVYDNLKFRQAAVRHWGNNNILFSPLLLGARGVWPRANLPTAELLAIPLSLRASCVCSCLKWGSTIHRHFSASVWRRRPPRAAT